MGEHEDLLIGMVIGALVMLWYRYSGFCTAGGTCANCGTQCGGASSVTRH